jgi:N-acetylmuramoyl-L-alanine amidase
LGQTKVLAGSNDVTGFVTRLYEQCLYREPDTEGLNYWANMLSAGTISGSRAAERFIYSSEFTGKNLSDDQYINVMYKTFFNRDADVSGKAYWLNMLQKGATRRFVLSRFTSSSEFEGICNLYGITRGDVELYNNIERYPQITSFTQRFYNKFQGRTPDIEGLTYWVDRLVSKESSAADLAIGFASSSEFIAKDLSNEDYVITLYKVFMDREPDSLGQAYWTNKLSVGYSRKFLLSRFLDSQEFKGLCSSYGINNGVIGTTAEDLAPLYTFDIPRMNIDDPANALVQETESVFIRGWALNASGVKSVKVYVDNNYVGDASLGKSRPDVNSALPGYPNGNNSGYTFNLSINSLNEGTHTIKLEAYGFDGSSVSQQKQIQLSKSPITKQKVIVVDAGHNHGGNDGAYSKYNGVTYSERDLNMQLAIKLKKKLQELGYSVIMTRNEFDIVYESTADSLARRVNIANNANADLFISIHHDSSTNTSVKGISTHWSSWRPNIDESGLYTVSDITYDSTPSEVAIKSSELSKLLANDMSFLGYANRGSRDHNLYVTKNTNMPSVLIENGFISNPEEAVRAADSTNQQNLANTIAYTIKNYLK